MRDTDRIVFEQFSVLAQSNGRWRENETETRPYTFLCGSHERTRVDNTRLRKTLTFCYGKIFRNGIPSNGYRRTLAFNTFSGREFSFIFWRDQTRTITATTRSFHFLSCARAHVYIIAMIVGRAYTCLPIKYLSNPSSPAHTPNRTDALSD